MSFFDRKVDTGILLELRAPTIEKIQEYSQVLREAGFVDSEQRAITLGYFSSLFQGEYKVFTIKSNLVEYPFLERRNFGYNVQRRAVGKIILPKEYEHFRVNYPMPYTDVNTLSEILIEFKDENEIFTTRVDLTEKKRSDTLFKILEKTKTKGNKGHIGNFYDMRLIDLGIKKERQGFIFLNEDDSMVSNIVRN